MRNYILFFLFFFPFSISADTLVLNQSFTQIAIGPYIEFYDDYSKTLIIENFLEKPDIDFQPNNSDQLKLGKKRDANIWTKFSVSNRTQLPQLLYILLYDANHRYIDAYITSNHQLISHQKGGMQKAFNQRSVNYKNTVFPIDLEPNSILDIYIKFAGKFDPVNFPIVLLNEEHFFATGIKEYLQLGIFNGLLIMFSIIALVLWIITRARLNFYFFLYSISATLLIFGESGLGFQYIYPNWPYFAHSLLILLIILSTLILFLLTIEYYKDYTNDIRFAKNIFKFALPFLISNLIIIPFENQIRALGLKAEILISTLPMVVTCIISLLLLYSIIKITFKNRNLPNLLFFFAFVLTILSGILGIFRINGVLDFPIHPLRASILLQLIFLSLLFVYKMLQLRQEKLQLDTEIQIARIEKEKAEKIKELDIARTNLYTNITHEFRTPLTVISGMADNISNHPNEQKLIKRNSQTLLDLINQILEISKLDAGAMQLQFIQTDLVPYLQYLVASFESFAFTQQKQISFYSEPDALIIDFDPNKLQRIATNLISNALKYTPKYGSIQVILKMANTSGHYEIKFKDTGVGIKKEDIPRLFNRFYQASTFNESHASSSGVGLALVKEIVDLHNGQIEVKSELEKGSCFTIQLPISHSAEKIYEVPLTNLATSPSIDYTQSYDAAFAKSIDKKNILLVEDNSDITQYLKTLLHHQYQLAFAKNGKLGVECALEQIPDIIISDIMMPEMDGYQLCELLKKDSRTSHIPIILLTAKAMQQDKIEAWQRGADAYLQKPFDKKELFALIHKLLNNQQRLQQHYQNHQSLPPDQKAEHEFLQKLYQVIEEKMEDESFGILELCHTVHLSRTQLYRKLKALTNLSPSELIRNKKIEKAQHLLQSTDLNISEIAYQIGFRDNSYFTKVFKEATGKNPSEWRA